MATFTPSSFSSPSAAFDDCSDDACSICLEPFTSHDPATITNCKHEYHLHCILEWSQRSKECPICWQLLCLKDPYSQELLTAVDAEKRIRSTNVNLSAFANTRSPFERFNDDHGGPCSDDSDSDDHFMQRLIAAANRARYGQRRERQRHTGAGSSEAFPFNSSTVAASGVQRTHTTSPSGGTSPTSGAPSSTNIQPPTSAFSPVGLVARNTTTSESEVPASRPSHESARRQNASEMFSIPESFKSKISAASARYKESIAKSTRDLKETLVARNASVKELSKGVQREMNAGFAGVARMIERLDLTSKRSTSPVSNESTSGITLEGKSPSEDGARVLVCHVTSDTPSAIPTMVPGGVEIPPSSVQNGQ